MRDRKLFLLYFIFLLFYYIFVVEILFSDYKILSIFEGNSFFSFSYERNMTMYLIMGGIVNSIAIIFLSSLVEQLKSMEVYIRIRLKGKKQIRFYFISILKASILIVIPKFFVDLIITEFDNLFLLAAMEISLLLTLLLYALIHLLLTFYGYKQNLVIFLLIVLNFASSMAYIAIPILGVLVFVPKTLWESNFYIIFIKFLFIIIFIISLWKSEPKFSRDLI